MATERQLAVALEYLRDNPNAPQVVAKGQDNLAEILPLLFGWYGNGLFVAHELDF